MADKLAIFVVGLVVAFLPEAARADGPPRYRLVNLGADTHSQESVALSVNRDGQVLIREISQTGYRTFIWRRDKGAAEIGLPGTQSFLALSLNDFGQILFHRRANTPIDGGLVVWTPNEREGVVGKLVSLQASVNWGRLDTLGILANDGSVISKVSDPKVFWIPIKWKPDQPNGTTGKAFRLEDHQTQRYLAWPTGVNDDGWVVGDSGGGGTGTWNVWRPDPVRPEEGILFSVAPPDDPRPGTFTIAAISAKNNMAVGSGANSATYVFNVSDDMQARQVHKIDRILNLPGTAEPKAINVNGDVVGHYGRFHSFLWTIKDGTQELTSLVDNLPQDWHLLVEGMNDKGWIVGMAYAGKLPTPAGGKAPPRHAFVLIPVG